MTNPTYTIVKVYSTDCKPCKIYSEIREANKKVFKDRLDIEFDEFNTDDSIELATELEIRSVPTTIIFNTWPHTEVARKRWIQTKEELQERIDLHTKI